MSVDVDIAVVGANLVGDGLWVVPLIEHSFDLILPFSEPEPNESFMGFRPEENSTVNFIAFIVVDGEELSRTIAVSKPHLRNYGFPGGL